MADAGAPWAQGVHINPSYLIFYVEEAAETPWVLLGTPLTWPAALHFVLGIMVGLNGTCFFASKGQGCTLLSASKGARDVCLHPRRTVEILCEAILEKPVLSDITIGGTVQATVSHPKRSGVHSSLRLFTPAAP
jgi:hypothetical protein